MRPHTDDRPQQQNERGNLNDDGFVFSDVVAGR